MTEEWRPVSVLDGYEVSNLGRVRSVDRVIECKGRWGGIVNKRLSGRVLKDFVAGAGYRAVMFQIRGRKHYVHRLVADAFLSDNGRPQINHKDGNKANNATWNLERVTQSENMLHSTHVLGNRRGQFVKRRSESSDTVQSSASI